MSMNSFELHNPNTLQQAIGLLDAKDTDNRRIRLMSGGQDLLSEMKDRLVEPAAVVNLKHIPGLDKIAYDPRAGLHIGALVKVAEVAESTVVRSRFPALSMAAGSVGSPQIPARRHSWRQPLPEAALLVLPQRADRLPEEGRRPLLRGWRREQVQRDPRRRSLLHRPSIRHGDGPGRAGASVTIHGPKGARVVPLEKFFALPTARVRHENVLQPNEIVTQITVPNSPLAARSVYLKFREKTSMDWAMSACAVALQVSGGKVVDLRIVLGGVAPIPWRVPGAEFLLKGRHPDDATLHAVANAALNGALALAHNAYKVPLTKTLVRRAILQAAENA